jgi:hypothetical protein
MTAPAWLRSGSTEIVAATRPPSRLISHVEWFRTSPSRLIRSISDAASSRPLWQKSAAESWRASASEWPVIVSAAVLKYTMRPRRSVATSPSCLMATAASTSRPA